MIESDLVLHTVNMQLSQIENVTMIHESKIIDVKLLKISEFVSVQLQLEKQYAARLPVNTK